MKDLKNKYIELIKSVTRPDSEIDSFIEYLEKSGFFTSPASTKYYGSYVGGLCEHSLKVYEILTYLVDRQEKKLYNKDTLILVSLLHDLSKIGYYEEYVSNKKVYSDNGSKWDDMGRYDWVSLPAYKVKEGRERYIFGSQGQNSERIASKYFPLSEEESAAIIWQKAGMDGNTCDDISYIMNKYPLVVFLHAADYIASYVNE